MDNIENNSAFASFIKLSESYVAPHAIEDDGQRWVMIGDNDDYYDYIEDCYEFSPTNNAIITSLALQIYGKGIDATDSARNVQGFVNLQKMLRPTDARKCAADLALYTSYAMLYIMSKDGKKIAEIKHIPLRTIRPEKCDEKGRIMHYGVSWDWDAVRSGDKEPQHVYMNWQHSEGAPSQKSYIHVVQPYSPSHYYFNPVSYQGGLKYAEIEKRLASFRLNLIKKGFSATTMINFNNGVPEDAKERRRIEQGIKDKFTGEMNDEPDTIAITFNADREHAPTIESVPINDAATQFEELSKEATNKIIVAHRVTSPMLVGVKTETGLGNNADEIKTAFQLFDNTTVQPWKELLLEGVDEALRFNGYSLDLYIKTLAPIEFTDTSQVATVDEKEKETGVKMSAAPLIDSDDLDAIGDYLATLGQSEDDLLEDFELVDAQMVEDEGEDWDLEAYLNREVLNLDANQKSAIDTDLIKVRYVYKETAKRPVVDNTHRPLCSKLMSAGLIYRKEDIVSMSSKGGAEDKGQQYNVFLHKGGANCQHGWERRIYMKRTTKDGSAWGGGAMNGVKRTTISQAIKTGIEWHRNAAIRKADALAKTAPRDTPTRGYKR